MDTKHYLEQELSLLLDWIKAADSRISLVLPLSSAMLAGLAASAPNASDWSVCSGIFSAFSILFLVLSIAFSAFACFPRTDGPKGSLIFFAGINNRELKQYKLDVMELTEEKLIDDLICQCHVNAQIAQIKFTWVKRSLFCLFFSSIPWFASIYLLYGNK